MKPIICVKIGGRSAADPEAMKALYDGFLSLRDSYDFVLIHGGGDQVTQMAKSLGHEPRFESGRRVTTEAEMEIVEAVLSGRMNKTLVRYFQARGIPAAGLCGSDGALFSASTDNDTTRTGSIISGDASLIRAVMQAGFLPVVASTAADSEGEAVNINADEAALATAALLKAECLIFSSDIPGIMTENGVLNSLNEEEARAAIKSEIITGGMIPKVESSIKALKQGVGGVVIGGLSNGSGLRELLTNKTGTLIQLKEAEVCL